MRAGFGGKRDRRVRRSSAKFGAELRGKVLEEIVTVEFGGEEGDCAGGLFRSFVEGDVECVEVRGGKGGGKDGPALSLVQAGILAPR